MRLARRSWLRRLFLKWIKQFARGRWRRIQRTGTSRVWRWRWMRWRTRRRLKPRFIAWLRWDWALRGFGAPFFVCARRWKKQKKQQVPLCVSRPPLRGGKKKARHFARDDRFVMVALEPRSPIDHTDRNAPMESTGSVV